ncbi:cupin, partial [Nocardiopsis sp. MG754419]|nr:cupin [Nocardiopsis sp. MG754419]
PADPERSARERRDLAIAGFTALRLRLATGDVTALTDLYDAALRLVADRLPEWRTRFAHGPGAEVARTASHLEALASGDTAHLSRASVHRGVAGPAWGMCGHL